jgi:hypothetical protein
MTLTLFKKRRLERKKRQQIKKREVRKSETGTGSDPNDSPTDLSKR